MLIVFDGVHSNLILIPPRDVIGVGFSYKAANHAASNSKGLWPPGIYIAEELIDTGEPDDGQFGRWFLRFSVPGRTGMGLHAGRVGKTDLAGREGWRHATMGCVRTTPLAMDEVAKLWAPGPEARMWVT